MGKKSLQATHQVKGLITRIYRGLKKLASKKSMKGANELNRTFSFSLLFYCIVLGRGTYGIYKGSYNISNISYLNSSLPPFFFILLSPHSWNRFNRYLFCIYIHVYTVFAPYSPSCTFSPSPPSSHWYESLKAGPVTPTCSPVL
jgi:hypothetical protein